MKQIFVTLVRMFCPTIVLHRTARNSVNGTKNVIRKRLLLPLRGFEKHLHRMIWNSNALTYLNAWLKSEVI